jgi:hypothetical protein
MTYATVKQVAKRLKISERRVRVLLSTQRMKGLKQDNGRWLIKWPLQIKPGMRGLSFYKLLNQKFQVGNNSH